MDTNPSPFFNSSPNVTGDKVSDVEPPQVRDDLHKRGLDEGQNRTSQLSISGLLQKRKLYHVAVPEVEVNPKTKSQVTTGNDQEHVSFVQALAGAERKELNLGK